MPVEMPLHCRPSTSAATRASPSGRGRCPRPSRGQGVFATSLVPVELRVSGVGGDFSMIPYGATDIRTMELPPMVSHDGDGRARAVEL